MSSSSAPRVQKHRVSLRNSGLRPLQIWVPDLRAPGFIEECQRQSKIAALADQSDHELQAFLDHGLDDLADL